MNAAFFGALACNKHATAVPNLGTFLLRSALSPDCLETILCTTAESNGACVCNLSRVSSHENLSILEISTVLHSSNAVSSCNNFLTSFLMILHTHCINCLCDAFVALDRPFIALLYCLARIAVMIVSHFVGRCAGIGIQDLFLPLFWKKK